MVVESNLLPYILGGMTMKQEQFCVELTGGQPGEVFQSHARDLNISTKGRTLKLINLPNQFKNHATTYANHIMDGAIVDAKLEPHEIGVIIVELRNDKTVHVDRQPTGKVKTIDGTPFTSAPGGNSWESIYVIYDQHGTELHKTPLKSDATAWAKTYVLGSLGVAEIRTEHRLKGNKSNIIAQIVAITKDTSTETSVPANHYLFFGKKDI
jgi:hypothetical protein